MIKFYYRGKCNSSRRALAWFNINKIEIQLIKFSRITTTDLVKLLSLTDKGFEEIIKRESKCSDAISEKIRKLNDMTFNECLHYIKKHPDILQSPIILENNKFLIGYNIDEIRKFIPKKHRRNRRI